jgi:hypothetical protein
MPVDNELLWSYVSGARNADDGRVKVIFRTSRDKGQRPWREPGRKHPSSAAGGGRGPAGGVVVWTGRGDR